MAADPDGLVLILIYCTLCGNRSMRNVETGRQSDMLLRVSRAELARMRSELPHTTCVLCGSPMDVKEMDDVEPAE